MGKIDPKSLCATCLNCSCRVVETHMDWDYKHNGQGYEYKYACSEGQEVWAHQRVTKCTHYCIEGRAT
jgi:hypothetical protein